MHHRRSGASLLTKIIIYSILAFFFGCDASSLFDLGNLSSLRPGPNAAQVNEDATDNNLFDAAQTALLPEDGEISVNGTVDGQNDVDIYALGPAAAGDRITIDVIGANGLNTVAALFDENKNIIDANDDRSYYAGQLDPYISRVIRRDMANIYVGVAVPRGRYFSSNDGRYDNGTYTLRAFRQSNRPLAEARQQVVYLNFAGGANVQIALQPYELMRAFSADAISQRFEGQTSTMADMVVELMRSDFADYDVVLVDGRSAPLPDGAVTQLYFGNYNQAFLGLSDNVDTDNTVLDQKGIIYTEDFQLFESLQPTMEEVAQAIANTGSHELGHLLGLEHGGDPLDIMSTAATARQILENDAYFMQSALDEGVFPAGWQDGSALLMQNVGKNPASATARVLQLAPQTARAKADTTWRAAYDFVMPTCGGCKH